MGTLQLMFVFLSFILFSYFVVMSNAKTETMLKEDAKYEMFDNMVKVGDLANEYFLEHTSTEPDVLQTLTLLWDASNTSVTTMSFNPAESYKIKISGEVIFQNSGSGRCDPAYWDSGNWTNPYPDFCCTYNPIGSRPTGDTYTPTHTYEWTITGRTNPYIFRCNECVGIAGNNTFIIEISRTGTPQLQTNTYDGFTAPLYLLNRPYSDITVEIVSDTLIHFTGQTMYEEITYERQCTPSNSMAIIQ